MRTRVLGNIAICLEFLKRSLRSFREQEDVPIHIPHSCGAICIPESHFSLLRENRKWASRIRGSSRYKVADELSQIQAVANSIRCSSKDIRAKVAEVRVDESCEKRRPVMFSPTQRESTNRSLPGIEVARGSRKFQSFALAIQVHVHCISLRLPQNRLIADITER